MDLSLDNPEIVAALAASAAAPTIPQERLGLGAVPSIVGNWLGATHPAYVPSFKAPTLPRGVGAFVDPANPSVVNLKADDVALLSDPKKRKGRLFHTTLGTVAHETAHSFQNIDQAILAAMSDWNDNMGDDAIRRHPIFPVYEEPPRGYGWMRRQPEAYPIDKKSYDIDFQQAQRMDKFRPEYAAKWRQAGNAELQGNIIGALVRQLLAMQESEANQPKGTRPR